MQHINVTQLPASRLMPVLYTLFVDDLQVPALPRVVIRREADNALAAHQLATASQLAAANQLCLPGTAGAAIRGLPLPRSDRATARMAQPPPDRKTWGLLPEHQAGLQRALRAVGDS